MKLSENEIKTLKKTSKDNWNETIDEIIEAHGGYPEDWYEIVIAGELIPDPKIEIISTPAINCTCKDGANSQNYMVAAQATRGCLIHCLHYGISPGGLCECGNIV